ncbi:alpha/beta hydrolase [Lampropedia cohaerens]|uniref:Alpha/beta hydrolase n=1 Tax=Lampropedia cohaerens TaxID=1610491 RepID=A0A0U1Q192_9BURK|nr:alpha/beta hydrolase [Lampropedia cohaerens]
MQCAGASKPGPNGPGDAHSHRMAYWDWPALPGADATHVILAVHGLTRNGRDFDVLARRLQRRARVICPDVAGRGRSDWLADPMAYQVPLYVADMLTLVAQVSAEAALSGTPVRRLDWIGTSMGGLIGLGVAGMPQAMPPLPPARLVLNDVGPEIAWEGLERIGSYIGQQTEFDNLAQGALYLREIAAGFGPHNDAQWLALSAPMFRPRTGAGVVLHYDPALTQGFQLMNRESMAQAQALLWALYDGLTMPTLVLRGAQSDLLSAATAQAMRQRGPRAQLVEFEGVGHAPTLVHADQIAVVEAFLFPS